MGLEVELGRRWIGFCELGIGRMLWLGFMGK